MKELNMDTFVTDLMSACGNRERVVLDALDQVDDVDQFIASVVAQDLEAADIVHAVVYG